MSTAERKARDIVEYYFEPELKDCPFCGTPALREQITDETYKEGQKWAILTNDGSYGRDGVANWLVWCSGCQARSGLCFNAETAIKYWNRRANETNT